MKNNFLLFTSLLLFGYNSAQSQQKTSMSLRDAVVMALEKSDEVGLANARKETRNFELQTVKNNRYPDVKASAQYLRLANADVDLKSTTSEPETTTTTKKESPKVNSLALGQVNMNMPIFSGFRLKNSIKASESLYKSEIANSVYTKEETAMRVIEYYADLYKAQQSVELLKESLKRSAQRVTDFKALEQNGIIARNDLLKSQLQVSKIQLSLDEAIKNVKLINYYLVSLLKLPAETLIEVGPDNIDPNLFSNTIQSESEALQARKDLEAVRYLTKASEASIKVAKAGYYPSISFTGGYIALDLQNVVTVQNAMNVGVGFSYNLSSIFKNGKEVKAAKSRALETQKQEAILIDRIKTQIVQAQEEYNLSVKQGLVYKEAVEQAGENYRIVKDKYDNGLSDTNDLLEADVEQLSAQINQANAKANVALKYYELLNVSGQLVQSFNLTQSQ
jgi:outer membrane protein